MLRRLFVDPLTVKELSGVSRRWQTYLGRVIYVGLTAFFLYMFWAEVADNARTPSLSEFAEFGKQLFTAVMVLQLLFAMMSGVSMASDMIVKEARTGTLGLLALTPLTPWRIVVGKWKAALAIAGSVVLSGAPVLAVCVYLGGAGVWELAWSLSLAAATAALSAALALFYSSVFRAGYMAIILSFVTLGLYTLLPAFVMIGSRSEDVLRFFAYIHPVYAAMAAYEPRLQGEQGWIGATLVSLGLAALLLRAAAARVSVLITSVFGPSLLVRTFEAMDRFYEGLGPRPLRRVRLFAGGGAVWEKNAILWKELRTRASGKLRYATRIGIGLLFLVLLPLSFLVTGGTAWPVPLLWFSSILLLLMAMAGGASLFVKEKEERKWDVLLSTPLTGWEIIRAKLYAGTLALVPLSAVLLLLFTLLCWSYGIGLAGWLSTGGSVALIVAFTYVLGAAASLRAVTLRGAFSFTFVALCVILILVPLFLAFLSSLPGMSWSSDEFPFVLVTLTNPAYYLSPFSEAILWASFSERSHRAQDAYEKLFGYFLVYACLYMGATAGLVIRMRMRFDRVSGRG